MPPTESRNWKIQYGRQAAILKMMLLKINRLLPIIISIVPLKFGVDTQSQTKVRVQKPTRRSENDNTPQPLDQWTNSPFMGQQVGNCKSFTLTYYLANLFAKHRGPRSIPLCIQHHIQLTSLSFQVSRPSHSEIQHFQNLTLKIQGQGHGWGGHWKSQHGSNIPLTHIPLIPCQSAILFLRYDFFKIWPWKSKVKVMGEGNVESHKVGVTSYRLTSLSFHVNRAFHSWVMTFSKFDLENQGSRSWVRSQFKVTMWV